MLPDLDTEQPPALMSCDMRVHAHVLSTLLDSWSQLKEASAGVGVHRGR